MQNQTDTKQKAVHAKAPKPVPWWVGDKSCSLSRASCGGRFQAALLPPCYFSFYLSHCCGSANTSWGRKAPRLQSPVPFAAVPQLSPCLGGFVLCCQVLLLSAAISSDWKMHVAASLRAIKPLAVRTAEFGAKKCTVASKPREQVVRGTCSLNPSPA